MRVISRLGFGVLAAASLVLGCGDEATQPPPEDIVGRGWAAFEAESFTAAADEFRAAIALNPNDPEAHNGLGWSLLRLSAPVEAASSFDESARILRQRNPFDSFADAHAGRTIAYHEIQPMRPDLVIAYADSTLRDLQYVFVHDTTLNWRDIGFLRIDALFAQGEFERANEHLEEIGGEPIDPASETFVRDLLAEIERLGRELTGR